MDKTLKKGDDQLKGFNYVDLFAINTFGEKTTYILLNKFNFLNHKLRNS